MPNPYNDVVITEAEKASLDSTENAIESPIPRIEESEDGANEVANGYENESLINLDELNLDDDNIIDSLPDVNPDDYLLEDVVEEEVIEIDGQEFSIDQVLEWKDDSNNKSNWNKTNTEKSQRLSKQNNLYEKINDDSDFKRYIQDYFDGDEETYRKLGLDGEYETEKSNEPSIEETNKAQESAPTGLEERVQELEFEKQVNHLEVEFDQLVRDNSEIFQNEQDEVEFLEFVEKNEMPDLNLAFSLYTRDYYKAQVEAAKQLENNAGRNQGKVIMNSNVGAREVVTPSKPRDYKDISMDNPDISKYFDK